MLGHKTSLNENKKIKVMQSIFSDYNGINLEINRRMKTWKFTYMWEIRKTFHTNKMKPQHIKVYMMQQKQF